MDMLLMRARLCALQNHSSRDDDHDSSPRDGVVFTAEQSLRVTLSPMRQEKTKNVQINGRTNRPIVENGFQI
jgi:hypothetical protein